MSAALARVLHVTRADLRERGRRGLVAAWAVVTILFAIGLLAGNVTVSSGSSAVGAAKSHVTSSMAVAQIVSVTSLLLHGLFAGFVGGLPALRDREIGVLRLLLATKLSAREYVAGKQLAAVVVASAMLGLEVLVLAVGAHALHLAPPEARGPFSAGTYVHAFLAFGMPVMVFVTGGALALALRTGKRAPVVLFPLALLLLLGFGVWQLPETLWRPLQRLLGLADPTGFSWMRFELLAEDRGVAWYNTAAVPLDLPFVASRLAFCALGVAAPLLVARRAARELSAARGATAARRDAATRPAPAVAPQLRRLERASTGVGMLPAIVLAELRLLRAHAGLWVSLPLVVLVTAQDALSMRGPFDTDLAAVPGVLVTRGLGTLTTMVVLLVLFTTVESFARERATGVFPLVSSAPVPSRMLAWGKVLASVVFGATVIGVAAVVVLLIVAITNPSAWAITPVALVWGGLALPTVFFAAGFFACACTLVPNRLGGYAVGLAAILATGWGLFGGHLDWWSNWPLWKAVVWSDMSILEIDRGLLVGNRLTVLLFGVGFAVVAGELYARLEQDPDAERATAPSARRATRRRIALALLPALVALALLALQTETGLRGAHARSAEKDYWRANVLTYADAKLPHLADVKLAARFSPADRAVDVEGTYVLANGHDVPIRRVPLTLRPHMLAPRFTLGGAPIAPEARAGLYVITLPEPLAPEAEVTVGFAYRASYRDGIRSLGAKEFLVPSGGTLTSFDASFVPAIGFVEGLGVDEGNRADERVYEDDFHVGTTPGSFGLGPPFSFALEATMPSDYSVMSVGVLERDEIVGAERVMAWRADAPIHFFNVVVGRDWVVARRDGASGSVEVRHHPDHGRNVGEMLDALEQARARYSEWFYPYPWRDLRLSEFPGLAHYAQGHPTNINFSESVGFLAAPSEHLPFFITAHEAAHQWWGTMVHPARGPGAGVMTEGLSHMSALMLVEAVKGPSARRDIALSMEARYATERSADGERPLLRVDGDRKGDVVLLYERGGWAFWMLDRLMTRPRFSRGMHEFVEAYRSSRDKPALADLFRTLRPFAEDAVAYDRFVATWFESASTPRFRVVEAATTPQPGGARVTFRLVNEGTGRVRVRVAVRGTAGAGGAGGAGPVSDPPREDVMVEVAPRRHASDGGLAEVVTVDVPFTPAEIVVDPDVEVLQLGRAGARVSLR